MPLDGAVGTASVGSGYWDFFISYTATDRVWAEWISWQLEEAGYSVLVQAWDFVPGAHWITRMADGVQNAQRIVAIISNAYLYSVYGRKEWEAAFRRDPDGFARRLIPIRVEDCPRPDLLQGIVSFDIFDLSSTDAKNWLLGHIEAALKGRAKPPREPLFPGNPKLSPPSDPRGNSSPTFPGQVDTTTGPQSRDSPQSRTENKALVAEGGRHRPRPHSAAQHPTAAPQGLGARVYKDSQPSIEPQPNTPRGDPDRLAWLRDGWIGPLAIALVVSLLVVGLYTTLVGQ